MMECTCGYEVKEPPYENWEECPNCDLKLDRLEWRIKRNEEYANLLRVARAAKLYLEHGEPELADDLEEALKEIEHLLEQ